MCESTILSTKAATVISFCKCCNTLYIWHNNIMLSFTAEQFKSFKKYSEDLDLEDMLHDFPDMCERIILRTPHRDISFTFTLGEWYYFKEAMDEALYMLEIYSMIEG
ncbi:hypothetical protein EOD41_05775 [Mucilaginibacter limnophilus]|uniref:Uncharacterized protein n=1 Tax=Mucilaginibacter limnophilus TaxID=1932778 RepID=A0A437MUY5_9SPHI|nr:DUF6686 family protein [Mucilaginibacter limnophilus]RVU01472.1 hypothetical protein EOD41_05775 [Mucilaginibacter limnophilus]